MPPLFFMHIPKTAGTSFRLGAQQYFTPERIVYDYGVKSAETSQIAHDCLYNGEFDLWRFKRGCEDQNAGMVGGHVNIGRFVHLFGVCNTLTFLRDPLQRMASEYAHFVRHNGYEGNFHDFYSRQVMRNRLSKLLRGVDVEAVGFVGLTERYVESLDMLNGLYGVDVSHRTDNRAKASLDMKHEIGPEDEKRLNRLNQDDIALYEKTRSLFQNRLSMYRQGLPYAHARLQKTDERHLAGYAWWAAGGDEPVAVEAWVNGSCAGTVTAVDFRLGLCRLQPPRGGYVGFRFPLELVPGDQVQCRVADRRGSWFPIEPYQVRENDTA